MLGPNNKIKELFPRYSHCNHSDRTIRCIDPDLRHRRGPIVTSHTVGWAALSLAGRLTGWLKSAGKIGISLSVAGGVWFYRFLVVILPDRNILPAHLVPAVRLDMDRDSANY